MIRSACASLRGSANDRRKTSVYAVAWSPDDRFVAFSSQQAPNIELWDAASARRVAVLPRVDSLKNSLVFRDNPSRIFTTWVGGSGGLQPFVVSVLDGRTLAPLFELPRPASPPIGGIQKVAVSRDSRLVAGMFVQSNVALFESDSGFRFDSGRRVSVWARSDEADVRAMDISSSGEFLVTGGSRALRPIAPGAPRVTARVPTVSLIHLASRHAHWTVDLRSTSLQTIREVALSPNNDLVAVAPFIGESRDGDVGTAVGVVVEEDAGRSPQWNRVYVLAAVSGEVLHTFRWGANEVRDLTWSPDGASLLASCLDGGLRILMPEQRRIRRITANEVTNAAVFSNKGDRIAMGDGPVVRILSVS